jgi:glycosyltransferase involved in cell wall biosynthesis
MRMIYLSNERFPSRDAVTIQQMQVAESFANIGLDLLFLRPFYFELAKHSNANICDYYGVEQNFKIKILPSLLTFSKPIYGVDFGYGVDKKVNKKIPIVGGASMMASTWLFIQQQLITGKFNKPTIIYSRNLNAATVFLNQRDRWFKNKPVKIFVEAHALAQKPQNFFDYIIQSCDGIVSITHSLKAAIIKKYNISEEKIFVAADGVRAKWLDNDNVSKKEIRKKIKIPDKYEKVVVYSGGFLPGKGVEVLVKAAADFDENVMFYFLGGAPKTISEVKKMTNAKKLSNVHFAGFIPPRDVSLYQRAADVLVLPNEANYELKDYTSPLKLFEYMAAERPIVATNLPVFHEILRHQENSLLVEPSNPAALAKGIRAVLADEKLAKKLSFNARKQVEEFSWDVRSSHITSFLSKITGWDI